MVDKGFDSAGVQLLDTELLRNTLGFALRTGGDFAEIFVEDRRSASAVLDDGSVEELTSGRDRGAGIRVVVGETTGFAHTADLTSTGLRSAAEAASAAARSGSGGVCEVVLSPSATPPPAVIEVFPADIPKQRKVALLEQADAAARAEGGLVTTVTTAWQAMRADRVLWLSVLGSCFYWSVASFVGALILVYGRLELDLDSPGILLALSLIHI